MSILEVSAHMTIRKGKLEGFKKQAAEIIRQTKEKDTKTLRYEWFLNAEETRPPRRVWGLIEDMKHRTLWKTVRVNTCLKLGIIFQGSRGIEIGFQQIDGKRARLGHVPAFFNAARAGGRGRG